MTAYIDRNDIEIVFGEQNVARWADLDGDSDWRKINARIQYAIETASSELEDVLRGRRYVFPLTPSKTLKDLVARMAALKLYDGREIIDGDPTSDKLSLVRSGVEVMLGRLRHGEITLEGATTTSIPEVHNSQQTDNARSERSINPFSPFRSF